MSSFFFCLVGLNGKGQELYEKLKKADVEVLFDDRDAPAGQKFADADLIGVPVRLVVSDKTGDKVEYKERSSDKAELLDIDTLFKKIK